MKSHGGTLVTAGSALLGGAAATAVAVLAGMPGHQAAVLLPGAISWGFFVRWCRRSFRAQPAELSRPSMRHSHLP
jgi:hypothetical protein